MPRPSNAPVPATSLVEGCGSESFTIVFDADASRIHAEEEAIVASGARRWSRCARAEVDYRASAGGDERDAINLSVARSAAIERLLIANGFPQARIYPKFGIVSGGTRSAVERRTARIDYVQRPLKPPGSPP